MAKKVGWQWCQVVIECSPIGLFDVAGAYINNIIIEFEVIELCLKMEENSIFHFCQFPSNFPLSFLQIFPALLLFVNSIQQPTAKADTHFFILPGDCQAIPQINQTETKKRQWKGRPSNKEKGKQISPFLLHCITLAQH